MKLERNEFMLCVEAISNLSIEPPYKKQIISAVESEIKKNKLDKQYSVNAKKMIKALDESEEEAIKELYLSIRAYWGMRDQEYSMTGESTTVNVNGDNYFHIKAALKRFLILQIEKYAIQAGSIEKLGLKIGQSEKYAQMILKRGSFSSLERLYKECIEKIDSGNNG